MPNDQFVVWNLAVVALGLQGGAAAAGKSPTEYLTDKSLAYFDRFGRNLRDGEAIEFPIGDLGEPARLTKAVRRKLLLSSPKVEELTGEIELRGKVLKIDQGSKTFHIRRADESEVLGPITDEHYDNIMDATRGYKQGVRFMIQGVGKFNRQGRLLRIDSIEHTDVLDPLDIPARFEELRQIRDGWLDGLGYAPLADGLNWLEAAIRESYPGGVPLPRIYPAPEGTVLFEWSKDSVLASLEVDLCEKSAYWHVLDTATGDDRDETLHLYEREGWEAVARNVAQVYGEQAE